MALSGSFNYANSGATPLDSDNSNAAFGQADMNTQIDPTIAYGGQSTTAWNQAGKYAGAGNAATQTKAPPIVNPYAPQTARTIGGVQTSQGDLARQLQATAVNGQDSQAYKSYLQAVAAGQNSTSALAHSGPAGVAGAGARRSAVLNNGMTQAGSAAGGEQVAATAQQAAEGQEDQLLGQTGQLAAGYEGYNAANAAAKAQLLQKQYGINFGTQSGYNNLALGEQNLNQGTINGAAGSLSGSQGIITGEEGANFDTSNMVAGAGLSALSDVAAIGGAAAGAPSPTRNTAASSASDNNAMGYGQNPYGSINT